MNRSLLAVLCVGFLMATTAAAQQTPPPAQEEQQPEDDVVKREEVVVVTASKVESTVINAPATVSVVTTDTIAASPAQNFGDLLRSVPGMNVIQMSARDINLTSRQSTSTLATSQLVLLDGRSVYLDFFGLVLWDLVPNNPQEIKQIEVVRGPASAVWGANALTGVVNIITKSPREMEGTGFTLTGGLFNRDEGSREDDGNGTSYGLYASIARAPSDRISYRLSGGYFNSDPYSRPVGIVGGCSPGVPCVPHPLDSTLLTGGAPYPTDRAGTPGANAFENTGTSQPKVDARLDHDFESGARMTYSAGFAGSEGIVHTGIGPFDLQSGSYMGYGKVGYSKSALKVNAFVNFLDAEAPNLLLTDPNTLQPVALNFKTQTFDLEIGHSTVVAGHHILSYGGNARRNNFDITLTPNAEDRNEFGAYFQDEIFYDKFRLALGGRVDKFGNIDDPVFSPRVTVMFKPTPAHSLRASYNRAFRSPSAVNNFLDQDIFAPGVLIDLRPVTPLLPPPLRPLVPQAPVPLVVRNVGNPNLKEESLTAYELAYTGNVGERTTIGLAVYQNDSDDNINFASITPSPQFPQGIPPFDVYTAQNPPPGIPGLLYGVLLQARIPGFPLPRTVSTYLNLGPIRQRGFEASLDHRFSNELTLSANYSYQDEPEVLEADADQIPYPTNEIAIPAPHRFNVALNWNSSRFVGSAALSYTDEAFWVDVLTAPFHGFTDSYTMLNASFGVKWAEGKVVTSIKGTNLTNETIQQHIFGDILKRSLVAEVRVFVP